MTGIFILWIISKTYKYKNWFEKNNFKTSFLIFLWGFFAILFDWTILIQYTINLLF